MKRYHGLWKLFLKYTTNSGSEEEKRGRVPAHVRKTADCLLLQFIQFSDDEQCLRPRNAFVGPELTVHFGAHNSYVNRVTDGVVGRVRRVDVGKTALGADVLGGEGRVPENGDNGVFNNHRIFAAVDKLVGMERMVGIRFQSADFEPAQ